MFVPGSKTEFSGNRRVDVSNSHQVTSDEPSSQYQKERHGQVRHGQLCLQIGLVFYSVTILNHGYMATLVPGGSLCPAVYTM